LPKIVKSSSSTEKSKFKTLYSLDKGFNHANTFMKIIKVRTRAISATNDESRQVLTSKIIWDVNIERFEVFRNNVKENYG
jgi:hypothetical protein